MHPIMKVSVFFLPVLVGEQGYATLGLALPENPGRRAPTI